AYIALCAYHRGRKAQSVVDLNRIATGEIMHKRRSHALLLTLEQLAAHYRSQQNQGELDKILAHMHTLFPDNQATLDEHARAARVLLEAGDYAAAAMLFGKVADRLQGRDLDQYRLARELASPGGSVPAIIASANAMLADNAPEVAARLYEEALKRNPTIHEHQEVMTKLGWCLYLQGKTREAERLWQQAVNSGTPGDQWRGQSRWHLIVLNAGPYNKPAEAIRLCEIQTREFEGEFMGQQALLTRAWLYWTVERWSEALSAFEDLCNAYPEKRDHPPIQGYIRDCEQGLLGARTRQR
ncbi:MAG: tetratricopeptide repeat protein, partial [Lentisphaerae bacterium]|nr:tetratricopeptide repeat protein [Lentisphaerota bacterium]